MEGGRLLELNRVHKHSYYYIVKRRVDFLSLHWVNWENERKEWDTNGNGKCLNPGNRTPVSRVTTQNEKVIDEGHKRRKEFGQTEF